MYKYFILIMSLVPLGFAQTTVNPDFSIIGQTLINSDQDTTTINGADIELAVTGYLNPFARAEVYLHKHDAEAAFELEEAVVSLERGLPFGTSIRLGKLRPSFGKINLEHSHVWPFVLVPGAVSQFSGEESWSSTGSEFSWLLPLPWYSKLSLATTTTGMSAAHHHHDDEVGAEEEEAETHPAFSVRSGQFIDLSPITHLEFGASYYREQVSEAALAALDLKFKWRPDTYRGMIFQSELYYNLSEVHEEEGHEHEMADFGVYAYLDYRFNKRWNLGFLADVVKHHEEDMEFSPAVFMGFSPVEETVVFRLVAKDQQEEEGSNPTVLGQVIWSLGPHKPHQF